jgi:hypothetical protein
LLVAVIKPLVPARVLRGPPLPEGAFLRPTAGIQPVVLASFLNLRFIFYAVLKRLQYLFEKIISIRFKIFIEKTNIAYPGKYAIICFNFPPGPRRTQYRASPKWFSRPSPRAGLFK